MRGAPAIRARGGQLMTTERAVLAGGCFWGMQDLDPQASRRDRRLASAIPVATRRTRPIATMARMRRGSRSSSIRRVISFATHPGVSSSRSTIPRHLAVKATTSAQATVRRSSIRATSRKRWRSRRSPTSNASGLWPGKVVTELEPVGDFWEAEPEHQDYLRSGLNGYTCHFVSSRLEAAAPRGSGVRYREPSSRTGRGLVRFRRHPRQALTLP
jgi:peptide-methionine (S)-S-oxide reductase